MRDEVAAFIALHGVTTPYLIAYSGGLDSTVLLHLLASLREEHPTLHCTAIHIHHGLSSHADAWAAHCQAVCDAHHVPLLIERVTLDRSHGESLEAAAREARYAAIATHVTSGIIVCTAHHENDQAETLLLQLFRGSGVKGLSSMPAIKPFFSGFLARPLLPFSRAQLETYATTHQLSWITDESNADVRLQRNYCRHAVLPVIEREWPSVMSCLARTAMHCANASALLEDVAQTDLALIVNQGALLIPQLLTLSPLRQENALRYWLQAQGLPLPSTAVLHTIFTDVIGAKNDATPCVTWECAEVRRFRERLYAQSPQTAFDTSMVLHWDLQNPLHLPGDLGKLHSHAVIGHGIKRSELTGVLEVRFRQGGEICYLPGRLGGHSLKHLFQEWRVPTWLRDRVPLLYHQGDLVAVVGYCVCDGFAAGKGEAGWRVEIVLSS